jgi:hypothetical protein
MSESAARVLATLLAIFLVLFVFSAIPIIPVVAGIDLLLALTTSFRSIVILSTALCLCLAADWMQQITFGFSNQ